MKGSSFLKVVVLLIVLQFSSASFAQRFLNRVFDEVDVTTDIIYGNAENYLGDSEDLRLDFYEPQGDAIAYRPLIIYVHGGGFVDEAQTKSLVHIVAYADSMASRGYTVATINYRLDSSISNRAVINAMHDAKAAVRFFRANLETFKIDTSKIFIGGESAGAITSLTTAYIDKPGEVLYPPTLPMSGDLTVEGNSGNSGFSSQIKAVMCLCGGTQTVLGDLLFDTLSIENAVDPPLLLVHGTEDMFIPIVYSLDLALRADHVGLPYLFYTLPTATHCPWFYPLEDSWEYLDTLIDYSVPFLYSCVTDPVGTEENDLHQSLILYPNPANSLISIRSTSEEMVPIQVYNLLGELIYQSQIIGQMQLDIRDWNAGIYVVVLPSTGEMKKFVVE